MKESELVILQYLKEGVFSIDDEGRIWRHRVITHTGKISQAYYKRRAETLKLVQGYRKVRLRVCGKRYCVSSHRLVWIYFFGDIPKGLEVNHKNGIKDDNRPSNLELVTPSENTWHAFNVIHPGFKVGKPLAILTRLQVEEIKIRLKTGVKRSALAKEYGVHYDTIRSIDIGKSWVTKG